MLRLKQAASGSHVGNLFFFLKEFTLIFVHLMCAHVKIHMQHVCSLPQKPEEGCRAPGTRATDGLELPDVGAGI